MDPIRLDLDTFGSGMGSPRISKRAKELDRGQASDSPWSESRARSTTPPRQKHAGRRARTPPPKAIIEPASSDPFARLSQQGPHHPKARVQVGFGSSTPQH